MADDTDDWLEGGASELPARKGELMTKSRLSNVLGYASVTVDKYIKEGAPVESRGSRRIGFRINSADFNQWALRYNVAEATGGGELQGFDAAKTREKAAAARLKEIQIDERTGQLVEIGEVTKVYERELGILRASLLAIPSRVGCSREIQDAIRDEIIQALTEITGEDKQHAESFDE